MIIVGIKVSFLSIRWYPCLKLIKNSILEIWWNNIK